MTKIKLSQSEINGYAEDITRILVDIPLFYILEVLELAQERREKEGDIPELDITSSEEEKSSSESSDDEFYEENKSDEEKSDEENKSDDD